MIIGFLGKGGVGKSSCSVAMTHFLLKKQQSVLAIDADHNRDFSFFLQAPEKIPTIGESLSALKQYAGIKESQDYRDVFSQDISFTLSPDPFTQQFSTQIQKNLRLMVAGPHTHDVLHDKSCSHSLITPLKVYLPFLQLQPNEWVIVDEKAGLDGAGTGITTGFDLAVVLVDPTIQSQRVAKQIIEVLQFFETPFVVMGNKTINTEEKFRIQQQMKPHHLFDWVSLKEESAWEHLLNYAQTLPNTRKERTFKKIERNKNA